MTFRIAVFTASRAHHVARTLARLLATQPDLRLLVIEHAPPRPARRLVRNQWRNLKRHGWRWLPYQTAELAGRLTPVRRATEPMVGEAARLETVRADPRVEWRTVAAINAADTVATLRAWSPDLGLALAAPILKPALFETPRLGTLNIHKGALPAYRGMPPAFWELWDGATHVGVTVHKVEAGLDTGAILLEDRIPIERHATPAGLRVRLDERGVELVAEAVAVMRFGEPAFRPQGEGGRTRSRPTLAQERELARRLAPVAPKARAKAAAFATLGTLRRLTTAQRDRVVVLLYHRVSDGFRDNVTIGVEAFDTQMRYLADHHRLVSLDALLDPAALPDDGPLVAVSFDDGYLDNYQNAAPILLKHGVHATFFVSTDHVGQGLAFAHDVAKLGRGLPNMSWDHIRAMRAEGLGFGSHTANHVNLAQADDATAEAELARSKAALQAELGIERPLFAYPFGKRADFNAVRLAQVQRAGYAMNASAYGGVNHRATLDRWDIRRQGIDHNFSLPALSARIAGWGASRTV